MSEIKLPYIIAVDFDGTLFEDAWPLIGDPITENVLRLKMEIEAGSKVILWTNRTGEQLQSAIEACEEQGIKFDAVNEPLPECTAYFGGDSRKVFANEYWDDRATRQGISSTSGIRHKILKDAIYKFGAIPQIDMAIEEFIELIQALCKYKRHGACRETLSAVKEEMADVNIMFDQLRLIFGDCMLQEDKKLVRLKRLLSDEKQ